MSIEDILESYGRIPVVEKLKRLKEDLQNSPGLGSDIKAITTLMGVKPCGGCNKRADKLDQKFPHDSNKSS